MRPEHEREFSMNEKIGIACMLTWISNVLLDVDEHGEDAHEHIPDCREAIFRVLKALKTKYPNDFAHVILFNPHEKDE